MSTFYCVKQNYVFSILISYASLQFTKFLTLNLRSLFLLRNAQTSPAPLLLEIVKAEGCLLWDAAGKEYIDLIGGISVANMGHCHTNVVAAIKNQVDAYMHVMVYGEFVQSPQVKYADLLATHLPETLNCVYFTNSGTEAVEGAMKLAKRVTGRTQIAACHFSYHGSTQGALSLLGDEYWRSQYRPLLPDILHITFNNYADIEKITDNTACIILETVQAEAGILVPEREWLLALRKRCTDTGTLLILDEIQAGFGRTGTLWAFEQYNMVPDVLLLGKALGSGMPLGAFIARQEHMNLFAHNPVLGHITTFGGHPVSCAAGLAGFQALLNSGLIKNVQMKRELFLTLLKHKNIRNVNAHGLWLAIDVGSAANALKVTEYCIQNGVITDWFLFAQHCIRISPPLTIAEDEIRKACAIMLQALDAL